MAPVKEKGPKPKVEDLLEAARTGDLALIRKLANNHQLDINKPDSDKRTCLHLACSEGKLPVVRRLVEDMHANTKAADVWGGTPLDDAIREGHKSVAEYLLSKSAPIGKNSVPTDDANVLCTAGYKGQVASLKGICRRGVNINLADYDQRTAIHLAASEGKLAAVKAIVSLRGDPNVHDRFGGTPLDDAVRGGHLKVKEYLEELGAISGIGGEVSTQQAADLCDAASSSNLDLLRQLVKQDGINVNSGDYDKRTAIHLAAAEGLLEVLQCLIEELGANPNAVDRWGGTPLNDAIGAGHDKVIEYLRSTGGVEGKTSLVTEDHALLFKAVKQGDLEAIQGLIANKTGKLQSEGIDINVPNWDKRTALHIAAADGNLAVVQSLLELQADANARDKWSFTPLDDACQFEHDEVIELLSSVAGRASVKKMQL